MRIELSHRAEKVVKKLFPNQQRDLRKAIIALMDNPTVGQRKLGDIAGVHVYKFKMNNQLTLLSYRFEPSNNTIYIASIGPHENFYRDLKR